MGVGVIVATFSILITLYPIDVRQLSDVVYFELAMTSNVIFDTISTVLVTIAVIKISKISRMLP